MDWKEKRRVVEMKINILFDTHGIKFTENAIKEKMVCSIIDRARNVVSKSTGKPLISIEDKNLLLEFARQIIDADENWDDGCPLCGSRI